MNFKRSFVMCLSTIFTTACIFQQSPVFAETIYTKGTDKIYTINENKAKDFLQLIKNLPDGIKWKMVIDANEHNSGKGGRVFDENRCMISDRDYKNIKHVYDNQYVFCEKNHQDLDDIRGLYVAKENQKQLGILYGESGYEKSVLAAWDLMVSKILEWKKIDAKMLEKLHDTAIQYTYENKPGYSDRYWPDFAKFNMDDSNSSYKGMLELYDEKNSKFEFEKEVYWNFFGGAKFSDTNLGEEPFGWESEKNIFSLYGALPVLDMIRFNKDNKNQPERRRLKLNMTFENDHLGSEYVDKAFNEFYKTLEQIKSDPWFVLPSFDLCTGGKGFNQFINRLIKQQKLEELSGMPEFLEKKYNSMVPYTSKSKNEKIIELIVRFCRALEQAHLFLDGNVRTCRLLMNMLLMQNNMLPALYDNFNTLDCFSVGYLVNEVKQGQRKFVNLILQNSNIIKNASGIDISR